MKSRIVNGEVEFELEKRELAAMRDAASVLDMINRMQPDASINQAVATLRQVATKFASQSSALPGQKTLPLPE